jgi:hypothetical protein
MRKGTSFVVKLLGWGGVIGVSLVVAGCGGSPPPVPDSAPTSSSAAPAIKVAPKGKRNTVAEGGEISAQDRRAARLKAKQAEGK